MRGDALARLVRYEWTRSRITDRVVAEMAEWTSRPLEKVYAALGVDLCRPA